MQAGGTPVWSAAVARALQAETEGCLLSLLLLLQLQQV